MPIVIAKKPVKVSENEMPFDGGVAVSDDLGSLYTDDQFEADLKALAKVTPKRMELQAEIKALASKVKEFDVAWVDVEKRVLERVLKLFPVEGDQEIDQTIGKIHVEVSKDSKLRSITDMKAVRKALGDEVFFQLAKINLGDIDKYTTVIQQEDFITSDWAGKRKITVQAIGKGTVVPADKKV